MKIGTDISIQVCRDEGYLVADVDKRAFNKAPTTTDLDFSWSIPAYVRQEMGWKVGDSIIDGTACLNYTDLFELYEGDKTGIDSFTGDKHEWTDTPDVYDVLHLASDIQGYKGLE